MYKHEEIISRLSIEEKISLISSVNALADESLKEKGIPTVKTIDLNAIKTEKGEVYPSFSSLANSWDTDLIKKVTAGLVNLGGEKVNFAVTPPAKPINNVYERGLTEDPVLSGKIVRACIDSLQNAGVMPCVFGLDFSQTSQEYADLQFNKRAFYDYYLKPLRVAMQGVNSCAVKTTNKKGVGSYADVNVKTANEGLSFYRGELYKISDEVDGDKAVESIKAGNFASFNSSEGALKNAYANYKKLKEEVEKGVIDENELEHALLKGEAIEEHDIDLAVDQIISFAYACAEKPNSITATVDHDMLSYEAAVKSTVLLKNADEILPLVKKNVASGNFRSSTGKDGRKVAVIGQYGLKVYYDGELNFVDTFKNDFTNGFAGYEDGYDLTKERSDDLIVSAVELAKTADDIVLLLGHTEEDERKVEKARSVDLPANQLALLAEIAKLGKNVIAVVTSSYSLNMKFEDKCKAVILAPVGGKKTWKAISDILIGVSNPSGKIAYTRFMDADARFERLSKNKDSGQIKIGQFIGYRNYMTAKQPVKYPFGFGLSYSRFAYSDARITADRIKFTLKNVGSMDGYEAVQVYVGTKKSELVRPSRELVAFRNVFVKAGETKTVSIVWGKGAQENKNEVLIVIDENSFDVYNPKSGVCECERCVYDIYVGSDVRRASYVANIERGNKKFIATGEKYSDYVENASNVVSGGYTLEKTDAKKKEVKPNKAKGWMIFCLLVDFVICILAMLANESELNLFTFDSDDKMFLPTILITVAVNIGLVIAVVKNAKYNSENVEVEVPQTVKTPIKTYEPNYDALFLAEFSKTDIVGEEKEKETLKDDYAEYFEKNLTMTDVLERFLKYTKKRGVIVDKKTAISTLSAIGASRMIILKSKNKTSSVVYSQIISGFFGGDFAYEEVNSSYTSADRLFFKELISGYGETETLKTINKASEVAHVAHFTTLTGVKSKDIGDYLSKCVRYVHNPYRQYKISVNKQISSNSYSIPSNVWFLLCLDVGEKVSDIPENIVQSAVVLNVDFQQTEAASLGKNISPVSFYQFVSLADSCRNKYELSEDLWKKTDKLENFVKQKNEDFTIGNRTWLHIEKFVGVCLALGLEPLETLDGVLRAKILPSAIPMLVGKLTDEDENFAHVVEHIFGEDNVQSSVDFIRESGLYGVVSKTEEVQ